MLENQSSRTSSWGKSAQYFIAIIITLIIGELVQRISLFSNTEIYKGLTSAELVNFLTIMVVLALFFIFTKHASNALRGIGDGVSFLRRIVIPVAALIIVCVAQDSIRSILAPYLDATGKTLLIIISSLAVLSAAIWVILAGYRYSPMLFEFIVRQGQKIRSLLRGISLERTCPACSSHISGAVNYCPFCGNDLELNRCKNCDANMAASAKYCGQCGQPRNKVEAHSRGQTV